MSDISEAIGGAFALGFSGFILLLIAQSLAGTPFGSYSSYVESLGIFAMLGSAIAVGSIVLGIVGSVQR